jgi:uncharacterized protein (TIGR02594 family)
MKRLLSAFALMFVPLSAAADSPIRKSFKKDTILVETVAGSCWFLFFQFPCNLEERVVYDSAGRRKRIADGQQILEKSRGYLGLDANKDRKEITRLISTPFSEPIDPVRTPWCAAFVNAMLKNGGFDHNSSLAARSFLSYGVATKDPAPGDIVVLTRGKSEWAGHVGFYVQTVEIDGIKYVELLGGNQDNQIAVGYYPINRVLGYRKIVS